MNNANNYRHESLDNSPYIQLVESIKRQAFHNSHLAIIGTKDKARELVARALYHARKESLGAFLEFDLNTPDLSSNFDRNHGVAKNQVIDHCTLYIDKVDQYSLEQQAVLMDMIKDNPSIKIIITSDQPLQMLIHLERLTKDLFNLISSAVVTVPPLRRRPFDIINLLTHLNMIFTEQDLQSHDKNKLYKELLQILWPGPKEEFDKALQAVSILYSDIQD